jgi:hypothetical protein
MPTPPLSPDTDFIVGEDKVLDYVMAFLFFALFMYGAIDAFMKGITRLEYLNYVFFLALAPTLFYFVKARNKRVYIRVNKTGIYQDEALVTEWSRLLDVFIAEKKAAISIKDNFILVIEYQKQGITDGFRRKIPLTNTQNKSEEEIMGAITFFRKLSVKG